MRKPVTEEEFGHRFRRSKSCHIQALHSDPPSEVSCPAPGLSDLQGRLAAEIQTEDGIPTQGEEFGSRRCPDICTIETYVCSHDSR